MADTIIRHLHALAQKDPDKRREALEQVLAEEGFFYTVQEEAPSFQVPRGTRNYLLSPDSGAAGLLFCAHYDAVPGSFGANDNAAAVCILIDLARALRDLGIPAYFAFFDGEETGNSGSRLYAAEMDRSRITGVVNLDVCGYGDTLAVYGKGHEKKPVFQPFCSKALLEKYRGRVVKFLPKSDDASFKSKVPALSLAMVPVWDIQYLNALSTYGEGFLGRPPEFDMMIGQMEVSTTMHGGFRDTPEWVEEETMQRMHDYLLEAMRTPPDDGKRGLRLPFGGRR